MTVDKVRKGRRGPASAPAEPCRAPPVRHLLGGPAQEHPVNQTAAARAGSVSSVLAVALPDVGPCRDTLSGMGLGFGLLSAQVRPGETDWTRAYDDTIRLAIDAERLGFTSVWTT